MYRPGEQSNRGICVAVIKNIMFCSASDKSLFDKREGYRNESIEYFYHATIYRQALFAYGFLDTDMQLSLNISSCLVNGRDVTIYLEIYYSTGRSKMKKIY